MNNKEYLQPLGKYILIHSEGEEKSKSILVPNLGTYQNHKEWLDKTNTVYAKGDEVLKVNVGDEVLLDNHIKLRRIDQISDMFIKRFGIQLKVSEINGNLTEELEKYFICKEEDIIAVIKK